MSANSLKNLFKDTSKLFLNILINIKIDYYYYNNYKWTLRKVRD